jgi:hypothetical protein
MSQVICKGPFSLICCLLLKLLRHPPPLPQLKHTRLSSHYDLAIVRGSIREVTGIIQVMIVQQLTLSYFFAVY